MPRIVPNVNDDGLDANVRDLLGYENRLSISYPNSLGELLENSTKSRHSNINEEPVQAIQISENIINNKPNQIYVSGVFNILKLQL